MDIIIGSGNTRQKVTFASGVAMRKYAKDNPHDYEQAKLAIVKRMRGVEDLTE